MRARPAAKVQNQNPNHIHYCRQDSWCQAAAEIQRQTFHIPCTVPTNPDLVRDSSAQRNANKTGDLARGWSEVGFSKLGLELPCIFQVCREALGGGGAQLSGSAEMAIRGAKAHRRAESPLQMASGRGSLKQPGSQRFPCRTWLFPVPRNLQNSSSLSRWPQDAI